MQKSTKRLLSWLVVLALVLTCAPGGFLAVETKAALSSAAQQKITDARAIQDAALLLDETATTCPCHPGETVTWELLPADGYAPAEGGVGHKHFYIEGTYTGTANNQLALNKFNATDSLCLLLINNAQVDLTGRFLFYANYGCSYTVNIMGSGVIETDNTGAGAGLLSLTGSGAANVNLYGGTFRSTGNTNYDKSVVYIASSNGFASVNVYNDVVIGSETDPTAETAHSTNVKIGQAPTTNSSGATTTYGGTLNMYGGTIKNGKASATGCTNGGNIYLHSATKVKFNMYAGTIEKGYATNGGNIYINSGAQVNLYGGTISGGYAATNGGNVYKYSSTSNQFNMHDSLCIIENGYAGTNGGNLWLHGSAAASTSNLTAGTIRNGEAGAYGGNIFANGAVNAGDVDVQSGSAGHGGNIAIVSGKLTMTADTQVTDGTASGTTGVSGRGGNIYLDTGTTTGTTLRGTISGGSAPEGGNVYIKAGTAVDVNANISGGTQTSRGYNSYGGNIYLLNTPAGTTIGGTISNGHSLNGTNIYMKGGNADISATITGGEGKLGSVFVTTDATYKTANVTFSGGSVKNTAFSNLNKHQNAYDEATMSGDVYITSSADGKGAKVTLQNNFDTDKIWIHNDGKSQLTVDSTWQDTADLYATSPYYIGDVIPTTDINYLTEYKATLTNKHGDMLVLEDAGKGQLKVPYADYAITNAEGTTTYTSAEDAVTAYTEGDLLVVASGKSIDIGEKAVTLDVIGTGNVVVTGSGIVSGIDRHNRNFDNNTGSITATNVAKDANYNDYRYIALKDAEGNVTFHRIDMKLTYITINMSRAGLAYKGEFKFDSTVAGKVARAGIALGLDENVTYGELTSTWEDYASANYVDCTYSMTSPHKLVKIVNGGETDTDWAIKDVYARPYLDINTGFTGDPGAALNIFEGSVNAGMSLADAINQAETKVTELDKNAVVKLQEFIITYPAAWSITETEEAAIRRAAAAKWPGIFAVTVETEESVA